MKIWSLLPSATEILFALGLGDQVTGVTHECDFPPEAETRPRVTISYIDSRRSSAEIDEQVTRHFQEGRRLYGIDEERLRTDPPDVIVTQDLCPVCAVSPSDFTVHVAEAGCSPRIVTLNPNTLEDVLASITQVGKPTGREAEAQMLVASLRARLDSVRRATAGRPARRVLSLEWLDPPMPGGHWVPEMVRIAGDCGGPIEPGQPPWKVRWDEMRAAEAEVIVLMPCGFVPERAAGEAEAMWRLDGWFAGQMLGLLNSGMLAILTSVGHRTGLFDKIATMSPSTSEQIANSAGLNERYVREWLGAMTTGGIVEYDPAGRTYHLPPVHAGFPTRTAGPNNMAKMTQFLVLCGDVEDEIVESFKHGGGVPYSKYEKFQELMAEESAAVVDASLLSVTLRLIPGMVDRLKEGIDVLDVGCGQGHAINTMARAFLKSRLTGYDFSDEGAGAGKKEAKEWRLSNAKFVFKDVATIDDKAAFDLITAFDAIHDQAHPAKVLKGINGALRPGGTFLMVDIAASSNLEDNLQNPMGPMLYSISTLHCMTVSLALGGDGLGTVWGEQLARKMLGEASFKKIDVKSVEADFMNAYYLATKD